MPCNAMPPQTFGRLLYCPFSEKPGAVSGLEAFEGLKD